MSPARKYISGDGKIVPITTGTINPFQLENLIQKVRKILNNLTVDDWIVPAGNVIINYIVGIVAYEKTQQISLLIWDNNKQEYVPKRIVTNPQYNVGNVYDD